VCDDWMHDWPSGADLEVDRYNTSEEYLDNLPPSMGWWLGGNYHSTYHLVREQIDDDLITYCGLILIHPVTSYAVASRWFIIPFCKNCMRSVNKWRLANSAEP
jgi:hypothetical protein